MSNHATLCLGIMICVSQGLAAAPSLENPGFEQLDEQGRLVGWEVHTGLGGPDFEQIVPGQRAGGRAGSAYCAGFPAQGAAHIPAEEHRDLDQPKAALSQTVRAEPGTYAFTTHLRTALGSFWSAGFRLGIAVGDASAPVQWQDQSVAVREPGRHPRSWGEWQLHESPAVTLDQPGPLTVWIAFHYINSSGMEAAWEVDDAALTSQPSGSSVPKTYFAWGPRVHIHDPSVGEDAPWYINDHCFVQDREGTWHLFGITHPEPLNPLNERQFAHATADSLMQTPWVKHPPAFHYDPDRGEHQLWAPHVVLKDDLYYMFYCAGGPSGDEYQINLRTSKDLWTWDWHEGNPLFTDIGDARDPMVFEEDGLYRMYYTRPSDSPWRFGAVYLRTSTDLLTWSEPAPVLVINDRAIQARNAESPFVVKIGDDYLLTITGHGYTNTNVYWSDNPDRFEERNLIARLDGHAPELIQHEGRLYYSHCGWGQGGVYLHENTYLAESLAPPNLHTATVEVTLAQPVDPIQTLVKVHYLHSDQHYLVEKTMPGKWSGERAVLTLAPGRYEVRLQTPDERLATAQVEAVHGETVAVELGE